MTRGIFITGASSGLGAALATAYAEPSTHLFLAGRDLDRLEKVAQSCRDRGATATTVVVDVTERDAIAQAIGEADDRLALDVVIANAGVSGGTSAGRGEKDEQVRGIFATNVDGVVNTVLPAIARMERRRHGQIALMASLAGYRGQPGAPAYAASKAAVKVWGEGLRGNLAARGVGVTVLCPGFVATPMTAINRFPMPFLLTADKAAALMRKAIDGNRARLAYPWPMAALAWLLAALPPAWVDPLLARLPGKG